MALADTADSLAVRPERAVAVIVTADAHVVLREHGEVTFGRGERVALGIGHDPVDDELVPPLAGAFFARDDRVVVANLGPRLALDIAVLGRPLVSLPPGEWHAPVDSTFTVVVQGAVRYDLGVTWTEDGARRPALEGGEATEGAEDHGSRPGAPQLTARQRAVLDAYVAPMAEGLPPATHQQVADSLSVCRQTIRLECNNIWAAFFVAGVPMRDRRDTRDAITDAWARHRL